MIPTISTYMYEVKRNKQAMLTAMERRKAIRYCIALLVAIAILTISALKAFAAPYGPNIPLPDNVRSDWKANSRQYTINYDSWFGGHWTLHGRRNSNRDGSYTDQFSGTCSAPNGTYTPSNLTWLSDAWYASNGSHGWISCPSFTITVSGGNVTGYATYTP